MNNELKSSSRRIGQLYPILIDHFGNIIDGEHRFAANHNWRKVRLDQIKTDKDRLIARIIGNNVRRTVPKKEKRELLARLGEIYFKEGIEPGKITYEIAERTGMSYQWVAKYLPETFKDQLQSERAKPALHCGAGNGSLVDPPRDVVSVRNYGNTDFVNIILKRTIYEQLEKKAASLETTPDILIYNAILLILRNSKSPE